MAHHHVRRRRVVAVAAVVAAGLGTAAARTTPFTPGAEATVVAGFLVVLAVLPLRWVAGGHVVAPRGPPEPDGAVPGAGPPRGWRWVVVVAPLLVALAWELVCFVHGDRSAWPTLSSLLDGIDAAPIGRAVAGVTWLGLGWALVTR